LEPLAQLGPPGRLRQMNRRLEHLKTLGRPKTLARLKTPERLRCLRRLRPPCELGWTAKVLPMSMGPTWGSFLSCSLPTRW
jgi:hypothetical protein